MTTINEDVREPLATALASITASVYSSPPEAIIAPACSIIPGTPYLEPNLINQSTTKVQINLVVSAIVAYNNNAGALDNLEKLMIQILGVLPSNYVVGNFTRPGIITVGTGNFLTSDLDLYTYYTQEN
jgi:hypothetical protein